MTLVPIRGAPPGASIPEFPVDEPKAKLAQQTDTRASGAPPETPPVRQSRTPLKIVGGGITITFSVNPELPAISRASMSILVVADPVGASSSEPVGFMRMSAAAARTFLTDLRNGRSSIVATGDEAGTVEIACEITETGRVFSVCKADNRQILRCLVIDRNFDMANLSEQLLADLGA